MKYVILAILIPAGFYAAYRLIGASANKRPIRSPDDSSVSDMTKVCLPQIQLIYPDFDIKIRSQEAEEALLGVLSAITKQDTAFLLHADASLYKQVEHIITSQHIDGRLTPFDAAIVNQCAISGCREENGHFHITFQCAVECIHYTLQSGEIIKGSPTEKLCRKYNMVLNSQNWLFTHFERSC